MHDVPIRLQAADERGHLIKQFIRGLGYEEKYVFRMEITVREILIYRYLPTDDGRIRIEGEEPIMTVDRLPIAWTRDA